MENLDIKGLASAMRRRAVWLNQKSSSHMQSGWGDKSSVVSSLLEMADVIDSWSGEYLGKEDSEELYMKRKYGYVDSAGVRHQGDYTAEPLTMDERIAYMRDRN